jgi:hypothetical protein
MGTLAARELDPPITRCAVTEGRVYVKTILALALVSRLGVVWLVLSRFPRNWLFDNALDLGFMAQSLSSGRGLSSPFGGSTGPTALVTWGYPAIVGFVFRLMGSYSVASAATVMVLQTLCAVLTVAVIMHIARRLFGPQTANLAGAFWAVSLPLLWMPIIFWETCLSTLLLTGLIAIALRCVEKPSMSLWVLTGLYCGLTMLVNPSLILAMFVILGWATCRTPSSSRYGPLVGLILMFLVFVPWPIRNAYVLHAFIPLRSTFGYELWQGNRAGADGIFNTSLYPTNNKLEYDAYASKGEVAFMREKSTLAMNYIGAHRSEFVWLTAKRTARFWMGTGDKINSGLMELHMATISLLGLMGLAALFKQHRSQAMLFLLPLLVYPLPYYITDVKFRYRLTVDPLLTILAAYAVIQLNDYLKNKRNART